MLFKNQTKTQQTNKWRIIQKWWRNQCSFCFVPLFWQKILGSKVQDSNPKFGKWRCYKLSIVLSPLSHFKTFRHDNWQVEKWALNQLENQIKKKFSHNVTMTILDHVDLKFIHLKWKKFLYGNYDESWRLLVQQSLILIQRPKMKVIFDIDENIVLVFFPSQMTTFSIELRANSLIDSFLAQLIFSWFMPLLFCD